MRVEGKLIEGVFIRELKNRFRCYVEVNGEERLCYVSSSSKLANYIDLEGKKVILVPASKNAKATDYTLLAVRHRNGYILLDLSIANAVIAEQISRRCFSFLGRRSNVKRETIIADYKTDLYVEDTNTLVEIKTVITDRKQGAFPTATSRRSLEQLRKISSLLECGYKCCVLFVALSPSIESIRINTHGEYYDMLKNCIEKGLVCKACQIKMSKDEITVNRFIDLII